MKTISGIKYYLFIISVMILVLTSSCQGQQANPSADSPASGGDIAVSQPGDEIAKTDGKKTGGDVMVVTVTSSAFKEGEFIPKKYTGEGPDVSPPLVFTGIPAGAKSIALICDDPDAPVGNWVHWVIFNIKPDIKSLAENLPKTAKVLETANQGSNDFRKIGYNGPMPPPGKPHRYFFKVYALDTMLTLPDGAKKADLEKAMKGHILAEGQLMGKYKR